MTLFCARRRCQFAAWAFQCGFFAASCSRLAWGSSRLSARTRRGLHRMRRTSRAPRASHLARVRRAAQQRRRRRSASLYAAQLQRGAGHEQRRVGLQAHSQRHVAFRMDVDAERYRAIEARADMNVGGVCRTLLAHSRRLRPYGGLAPGMLYSKSIKASRIGCPRSDAGVNRNSGRHGRFRLGT